MGNKTLILLVCLVIASCGGGGGDGSVDKSSRSTLVITAPSWVTDEANVNQSSGPDLFGVYLENALFAQTLLTEYGIFDILTFADVWRRDVVRQRQSCDRSGSLLLEIKNSGRDTFVDFDDCVDSDGITTNGNIEVKFIESGAAGVDLRMSYDFIDINVKHSAGISNLDMTYVFEVDYGAETIVAKINGRGTDSSEDDFDVKNLTYTSPISHSAYLLESQNISGTVARETVGYVDLASALDGHGVRFSDGNNTFEGGYELSESGRRFPVMRFFDGLSASNNRTVSLPDSALSIHQGVMDFFTKDNIAPSASGQFRADRHDFSGKSDEYKTENIPYPFHLNGLFYDPNGDFLEFEVQVDEYALVPYRDYPIPLITDVDAMDIQIVAVNNAEFSITLPQPGEYRLSFRAKDPEGAFSEYIYQAIIVEDDTDGDGIPSPIDRDDDNDGVEDYLDAFPYDNSETTDTDRDGLGNNIDWDDDADGIADMDDAFPLDAYCRDAVEGNDDGCYYTLFYAETRQWDHRFASSNGYAYFYSKHYKEIAVFNVGDNEFLPKIGFESLPGNAATMIYYEALDRIYIGFDNGDIYYVVPGQADLIFFTNIPNTIVALAEAGDYLLVVGAELGEVSSLTNNLFSFDSDGNQVDEVLGVIRVSTNFKWDEAFKLLYSGFSRTRLDVASGLFSAWSSPEHPWPLGLSPDGSKSIRDVDHLNPHVHMVLSTVSGEKIGEIARNNAKPEFWLSAGPVGFNFVASPHTIVYWNNDFSINREEDIEGLYHWPLKRYQWGERLVIIGTGWEGEAYERTEFLKVDIIDVE